MIRDKAEIPPLVWAVISAPLSGKRIFLLEVLRRMGVFNILEADWW